MSRCKVLFKQNNLKCASISYTYNYATIFFNLYIYIHIYSYIYICIIIRDNVAYEGFRVLDTL